MKGLILSINISAKKGEKKRPVSKAILLAGKGLENDAHFATQRQVSFLNWESAKKLQKKSEAAGNKIKIRPGDFAENITTVGIDWKNVSAGDRVIIKNSIMEITEIGKECHTGCAMSKITGDCIMPKEGVFAKVIKGGFIGKGDIIKVKKMNTINISILTCSDKGSRGQRIDTAGPAIKKELLKLEKKSFAVNLIEYKIVPDEKKLIAETLKKWCDEKKTDIIFTTGGTGFGPRDWTPEATREVMQRLCPGIPEFIRWESFKKTKFAAISRATAGIRGQTLIINLPGSEKAAREISRILLPIIPHSIEILRGHTEHKI